MNTALGRVDNSIDLQDVSIDEAEKELATDLVERVLAGEPTTARAEVLDMLGLLNPDEVPMVKRECTHCHRPKPMSDFMKGIRVFKTCKSCRASTYASQKKGRAAAQPRDVPYHHSQTQGREDGGSFKRSG